MPDQIQCQYATRQKDFTLNRGLLYLKTMPSHSNKDVLAFVVPTHKRQAAVDGCHRYTGHQGHDHTLSLIMERFWWPEMVQETVQNVCNCGRCIHFDVDSYKCLWAFIECFKRFLACRVPWVSPMATGVTINH